MSLYILHKQITAAKSAFDVFGLAENIDSIFRKMAKMCHEDLVPKEDKQVAHETFLLLKQWYDVGTQEIINGTYGKKPTAIISTNKNSYIVDVDGDNRELVSYFICRNEKSPTVNLLLKTVNDPKNNELFDNEIKILKNLQSITNPKHTNIVKNHTAKIIEAFNMDGCATVVLDGLDGFFNLQEVKKYYPNGVDLRAAIWMFNRMLGVLGVLEANNYVNANLIPSNFYINPETHNGKLLDFTNACEIGQKAKFICSDYKSFYPKEIEYKKEVKTATDVYMAAKCFIYLVGNTFDVIPKEIQNFIKYCIIEGQHNRPQSAIGVFCEFKEVCEKVLGKPKFAVFQMPP